MRRAISIALSTVLKHLANAVTKGLHSSGYGFRAIFQPQLISCNYRENESLRFFAIINVIIRQLAFFDHEVLRPQ